MKDALGNDIIIGKFYGYSQNKNGMTHIKVGEAVKFNAKSVTLEVIYYNSALYDDDPSDPSFPMTKTKISVKGNMLFPVNKNLIKD